MTSPRTGTATHPDSTPLGFVLNGAPVAIEGWSPTTTLLQWLRRTGRVGTKEGCAEGDCGACTVAVLDPGHCGQAPAWHAVNACLVLLPTLHGREVVTVEGLARADRSLHPVQAAMIEQLGSQCGYCTPGVVMSLFEAHYRRDLDAPWKLDDQLCGNLCRCTGYRPIGDAARATAGLGHDDGFANAMTRPVEVCRLSYTHDGSRFERPASLAELWDVLGHHPNHRIVAGATDLGLEVTKRHRSFPCLVALDGIPELRQLESGPHGWSLGAAIPLSALEAWSAGPVPALGRMLRFFGSRQIKNRATLGGNLCNASPIGDLAPVLMALSADVVVGSARGERRLALEEFLIGYRKTALAAGEVLLRVHIPRPAPGVRFGAYKVSKRRELDISTVCAGFSVRTDGAAIVEEIRLCYGGMAETTARAHHVEAALRGGPWTREAIEAAVTTLDRDFRPISDLRGSAWYRRTVARNLLIGFWLETRAEADARLPDRPTGTVVAPEVG